MVDINGLFARITGRITYNETTKLNNGMLDGNYTVYQDNKYIPTLATNLTNLSKLLEMNDISFIYVQEPSKMDLSGSLLPAGLENYPNENVNELITTLSNNRVNVLDLRNYITDTPEHVSSYFYNTDHHWNPAGAFIAFQQLMAYLSTNIDSSVDTSLTGISLWQKHSLDNWFLGSRGKRVGRYYAGTDPLIWYTPLFETNMSCAVINHKALYTGSFEDAVIRNKYIDQKNYYKDVAYCVYIGGDYPLVKHRNPNAPNHLKVLIIKDSFMLPLQSFLSTEFTEVDVIDPRHYKDSTIVEYCKWTKPDIVIFAINPGYISSKDYYNVGDTTPRNFSNDYKVQELVSFDSISLKATDNNHYCKRLLDNLNQNQTYSIELSGIQLLEGNTEGVSIIVFDWATNRIIRHEIVDLEYSKHCNEIKWTFKVPKEEGEHDYSLLIYAGIHGNTAHNSVEYKDIEISILE